MFEKQRIKVHFNFAIMNGICEVIITQFETLDASVTGIGLCEKFKFKFSCVGDSATELPSNQVIFLMKAKLALREALCMFRPRFVFVLPVLQAAVTVPTLHMILTQPYNRK